MFNFPTSEPLTTCNKKTFFIRELPSSRGAGGNGQYSRKVMHISLHFFIVKNHLASSASLTICKFRGHSVQYKTGEEPGKFPEEFRHSAIWVGTEPTLTLWFLFVRKAAIHLTKCGSTSTLSSSRISTLWSTRSNLLEKSERKILTYISLQSNDSRIV